MKRAVYGYMRAYESTPDFEVMLDELELHRWARLEGYELAGIYQEVREGSIDVLTDLIEELSPEKDEGEKK